MVQEFVNSAVQFLNISAVYYVIQLVRCVLLSFAVFVFVFTLRKTILKNKVFLKGALWSLFIPGLFVGKMKFFYENRIGVKWFSWLTDLCMNHVCICWLYLFGIFVYAVFLFGRRKKVKKMAACMEETEVDGTFIYVTDIPVTPSTIGVFKPKIVIPEIILKEYDKKELQTIIIHEKTHIWLGHLLFYLFWDILRVLLWLNPFLTIGTKYFREDMEEICDFVTIQRSKSKAYTYGQLLLKSMRILQSESEDFNMYATFAGDKEYKSVRQRVKRIAGYKPYKKGIAVSIFVAAMLCMAVVVFCIHNVSYGRYNQIDSIVVYDMETGTELISDKKALREAVCYDDKYIYIKAETFQELIKESTVLSENICFYSGGYYKLPGIGGGGGNGYLEEAYLENGILKIKYVKYEDIFERIFKMI